MILLLMSQIKEGQSKNSDHLIIELGTSYNILKHSQNSTFLTFPNLTHDLGGTFYRKEFQLSPEIRLSWQQQFFFNTDISTAIGYTNLGGKSEKFYNNFEDEIKIKALYFAALVTYPIKGFSFGMGLKYNYHLKMTYKYYGDINRPINDFSEWEEMDLDDIYKTSSLDLGIRTNYTFKGTAYCFIP